ncbi:hypothetical protein FHX69_1724 [Prauserella muralis]|nr:hypothetical protein FHX69_1724 [Prauserella muralis]
MARKPLIAGNCLCPIPGGSSAPPQTPLETREVRS